MYAIFLSNLSACDNEIIEIFFLTIDKEVSFQLVRKVLMQIEIFVAT